jgi:hypothetical protein
MAVLQSLLVDLCRSAHSLKRCQQGKGALWNQRGEGALWNQQITIVQVLWLKALPGLVQPIKFVVHAALLCGVVSINIGVLGGCGLMLLLHIQNICTTQESTLASRPSLSVFLVSVARSCGRQVALQVCGVTHSAVN